MSGDAAILAEALAHQRAGRLDRAEALLRDLLQRRPHDADALHLLGIGLHQAGRGGEAVEALRAAVAARPQEAPFHNNLGSALRAAGDLEGAVAAWREALRRQPRYPEAENNLGTALQTVGRLDEALACYERALAQQPGFAQAAANRERLLHSAVSEQDLRDLFIASIGREGLRGDFRGLRERLARQRAGRALIVVAAPPKTASTFLANLLVTATGLPYANLCYSLLHNEHELYPPALLAWNSIGAVSQLHMKGTLPNARLMRFFDIRPLLPVRNVFDIVASLLDQFRDRRWLGAGNRFSFAYVDAAFLDLPPGRQVDFMIDLALPWYLDYVASWSTLIEAGEVDALWLGFDELTGDTANTLQRVVEFLRLEVGDARAREAAGLLARQRARLPKFNQGVTGRGAALLSDAQRERIRSLTAYYPALDFSVLGL